MQAERLSVLPTCQSGKVRFIKRRTAKLRGKQIGSREKKRFRVYRCEYCGDFHLATKRD